MPCCVGFQRRRTSHQMFVLVVSYLAQNVCFSMYTCVYINSITSRCYSGVKSQILDYIKPTVGLEQCMKIAFSRDFKCLMFLILPHHWWDFLSFMMEHIPMIDEIFWQFMFSLLHGRCCTLLLVLWNSTKLPGPKDTTKKIFWNLEGEDMALFKHKSPSYNHTQQHVNHQPKEKCQHQWRDGQLCKPSGTHLDKETNYWLYIRTTW